MRKVPVNYSNENTCLTPDTVKWAFRFFLGREPETEEIINEILGRVSTLTMLRKELLQSDEFFYKTKDLLKSHFLTLNGDAPPLFIEEVNDLENLALLFNHIQKTWEHHGTTDPYYSVLSQEEYKGINLKKSIDAFYATGENDVKLIFHYLKRNHIDTSSLKTCLEYGCGLGRTSYWLSQKFKKVYACDISRPHAECASNYLLDNNITNVTFHHIEGLNDIFNIPKADVVYSLIVLQHNPPPLIALIIKQLLSALNDGGVALFQVPTYRMGYSFVFNEYLQQNYRKNKIEMHILPQSTIFKSINEANAQLVEVLEDRCAGYDFHSNTFLVKKL